MTGVSDLSSLLGRYLGEPEIATLLLDLGIVDSPKLERGEATSIVANANAGIEVTFRDAEALDVATREYPEGALVLSNVRFYGIRTDDFDPYVGPLPSGVTFAATKQTLIGLLGTPARDNLALRQVRWDFDTHCVFAKFGDEDGLIIFSMQLPIG